MKHVWSILCEKTIIDIDTNSLNIHNCFDELNINIGKKERNNNKKILIPVNFEIIHLLFDKKINQIRNPEIKIELYDPENKNIGNFSELVTFPKQKRRLRIRTKMNNLPITVEGTYNFLIKLKENKEKKYKKVSEIPLDIKISDKK
ncbi:hypothetical protein KJ684_00435 [Patescibacteria group bacterium]|nr:hypothetical protein [Patescibacteria group bacterium]